MEIINEEFIKWLKSELPTTWRLAYGTVLDGEDELSNAAKASVLEMMAAWKASREAQNKEISHTINLLAEMYDWAHPEITKYMAMWEGRRDKEIAALQKILSDVQSTIKVERDKRKYG